MQPAALFARAADMVADQIHGRLATRLQVFRALDYVIATARTRGIRIQMSVTTYWQVTASPWCCFPVLRSPTKPFAHVASVFTVHSGAHPCIGP